MVASRTPPTGDVAHHPGLCPDWESKGDPLVHRPAHNPLSHTSQGWNFFFNPHLRTCLLTVERGEERERNTDVRDKCQPHIASNMCPDQESKPQPFGVRDDAPTEPRWPGLMFLMMEFSVLSNKEEGTTGVGSSMDKPLHHYAVKEATL